MNFAGRLQRSRPAPTSAPDRLPAPPQPRTGPGFLRRRLEIPMHGPRPSLLGGAIDRLAIPDARTLAESLAAVGVVRRGGLPLARPAVLLDLETTGLGRDAGCIPFMVGLAWHEGDALVVTQWILARLCAEAAMLREVEACLQRQTADGAAIVTFNGASFDLPLLRARWVRHRLARPGVRTVLDETQHLDLLVAARRLWKGRRPDCRLATLERLELSVQRHDDVHGSQIADAYWRWLAAPGDPSAQAVLDRIEAHNRVDLVSLAGLAAEVGVRLSRPAELDDALRAATHYARQQRPERALAVLAPLLVDLPRALGRPSYGSASVTLIAVALLAADLRRRTGDLHGASALWAAVCHAKPGHPEAHDRLAKYLEHGGKDPAAALAVATRSTIPCPRRIARLHAKLAASGAAPVAFAAALTRVAGDPHLAERSDRSATL